MSESVNSVGGTSASYNIGTVKLDIPNYQSSSNAGNYSSVFTNDTKNPFSFGKILAFFGNLFQSQPVQNFLTSAFRTFVLRLL